MCINIEKKKGYNKICVVVSPFSIKSFSFIGITFTRNKTEETLLKFMIYLPD